MTTMERTLSSDLFFDHSQSTSSSALPAGAFFLCAEKSAQAVTWLQQSAVLLSGTVLIKSLLRHNNFQVLSLTLLSACAHHRLPSFVSDKELRHGTHAQASALAKHSGGSPALVTRLCRALWLAA